MSKATPGESWLDESKKANRLLFSELDVLLRALDRFFTLDNLPASRSPISQKNLHPELSAARDVILRVLAILDIVIPESNRNAYWFQKFAENKLLDNRTRDMMRAGMYRQDTAEKSLYLLYDSFISLKSLSADILKSSSIEYSTFRNFGNIIGKEIRENEFFNPFRLDINPQLDFIDNREIKEIVRGISDKEIKKTTSILFLHLFRLFRFITHMDHKSMRPMAMSTSILIFSLLKSEVEVFRSYIEMTAGKIGDEELVMLLRSLSYQFSMESKRVFQQELKDIFDKKTPSQLRGKIENSRGILKNLTEQAIIQLARHWNPNVKGERIFDFFINKTSQSVKLREDIYVLNRLLKEFEQRADSPGDSSEILKVLMSYMDYFEDFAFKLIRFDDFEEFSRLFHNVRKDYDNGADMQKILDSGHHFSIFLDTTLRHIENRAELKGRKLDVDKMEDFVRQYLPVKD